MGSVVAMHRLSCSIGCGVSVPQPGIKPMSLALEGGFLTTGPREVPDGVAEFLSILAGFPLIFLSTVERQVL